MCYLLSVVEVCSVLLVFELGRLHVVLQAAEVVLAVLHLGVGLESLVERRLLSLIVLAIDSGASCLGKGFAEEVLRLDLGHVTSVARHMLSFQVLSWAT